MANGTAIDPTKPLTESWDKRVNQCSPALYACAAQNVEHIIVAESAEADLPLRYESVISSMVLPCVFDHHGNYVRVYYCTRMSVASRPLHTMPY